MKLTDFVIGPERTYLDALRAIDRNAKGFVIVADGSRRVLGTLTDGDVRRNSLVGVPLEARIGEAGGYSEDFTYALADSGVDELIERFQDPRIHFLPILDGSRRLVGVVTRKQLYSLLLQCRDLPPYDELLDVDENLMDFEIFRRPWGIYKTTVLQDGYQSKVLQVKPGGSLSLQYHERREEHWVVASGTGEVQLGHSTLPAYAGSVFFIPKGCIHRMTNSSDTDQLVVVEIQIGDYFGEDDIVRIEDKYGRATEGGSNA